MAKHVKPSQEPLLEDGSFDDEYLADQEIGYDWDEPFREEFSAEFEDEDSAVSDADAEDAGEGVAEYADDSAFEEFFEGSEASDDVAETGNAAVATAPVAVSAFEEARLNPSGRQKSLRSRFVLIGAIIVLVCLIAALGGLVYNLMQQNDSVGAQQAQSQQSEKDKEDMQKEQTSDAGSHTAKRTDVPALVSLLNMTQEQAIEALAHGATVTATRAVNEKGNAVKTALTVTLTEEPADSRTGTPTVYLYLNKAGQVIQAGYSAGTATLGYGSLSFEDMVKNEKIIQKTFGEAGLTVPDDAVVLPANRSDYTTYAGDGKTVTRESCSFDGTVTQNGVEYAWDAVLLYDYAAANSTGNLANTLRQVYAYVGLPQGEVEDDEEEEAPAEETPAE